MVRPFGATAPSMVVVRPYTTRLRSRVFDVLRLAGLEMDTAPQIPAGTSDAEAVAEILRIDPSVLLVPFNAHRDATGRRLDGLSICLRLAQTPGARVSPVLMPVSRMAAANLRLTSHSGGDAELYGELLRTRILVLEDDVLDDPQTPSRVVEHLRSHGVFLDPAPAS